MADLEWQHTAIGPWDGLNESNPGATEVLRAVNVDFEGGRIRRRLGRVLLGTVTGSGARPVAGLHQHVGQNGERVLLATLNWDQAAGKAGPAVVRLDGAGPADGTVCSLPIRKRLSAPATPDTLPWSFATYRNHTIMAEPGGKRLLAFDGENVIDLEPFDGLDKQSGLAGASSYLTVPPKASRVAVWRNRLVAGDGRTCGISASIGDAAVPADAPVGPANVWPVRTNFDVLTRQGDHIQNIALIGDRLAVFTRGGAAVVNEDDLSPILSIRDRKYGCIAPGSVVECAGEVFYLTDGMVVSFDGDTVKDVSSEPLAYTLRLVDWAIASRAIAVHYARRNEYRIWLPTKGDTKNRLCLIFNYVKRKWRVYAGGPWASWGNPASESSGYDVTAACTMITGDNREILVTGDSTGNLWLEDAPISMDGAYMPVGYFLLPPLGQDERVIHWGGVRLDAIFDGSFLEVWAMFDGVRHEEELARWVAHDTMRASRVKRRALRNDHATFDQGATWDTDRFVGAPGSVYFSTDRRKSTRMQVAVVMPGSSWEVVNNVEDPARGGVRSLEIAMREMPQGRSKDKGATPLHDGAGGVVGGGGGDEGLGGGGGGV